LTANIAIILVSVHVLIRSHEEELGPRNYWLMFDDGAFIVLFHR